MTRASRIEKIIEDSLLAISDGRETLASILEKHPKEASAIRPRLEAALWLAEARKAHNPRPGFVTSSRHYIERAIALTPPRNSLQRLISRYSPQRWVFILASPVLLIIMLALMINGLVLTARLAIPGEPFYNAKLMIEDVQLTLTFDPQNKADLYLQFSRERAAEFVELVLDGDYTLLPAAANRMESDIIGTLHSLNTVSVRDPGMDLPMITNLKDTLSNEILMLNVLRDITPTSAHGGIDLAIQVARTGIIALH